MAGVHVLSLRGDLDRAEKRPIERGLSQIERFGPQTVTILDLSGARYVDSTVLNALCQVQKRLEMNQPGSSVCVVAPPTNFAWRLFEITQLNTIFRMFDDIETARHYASRLAVQE